MYPLIVCVIIFIEVIKYFTHVCVVYMYVQSILPLGKYANMPGSQLYHAHSAPPSGHSLMQLPLSHALVPRPPNPSPEHTPTHTFRQLIPFSGLLPRHLHGEGIVSSYRLAVPDNKGARSHLLHMSNSRLPCDGRMVPPGHGSLDWARNTRWVMRR